MAGGGWISNCSQTTTKQHNLPSTGKAATIKQTYSKHGHVCNLNIFLQRGPLDYGSNVRLSQTQINFHFKGSASTIADDVVFSSFVLFHIYKTYILKTVREGGGERERERTKEFAFKSKGTKEYPLGDYYHLPHRKLFKVDPKVCACNLEGTI
jgi:hypothetical protein